MRVKEWQSNKARECVSTASLISTSREVFEAWNTFVMAKTAFWYSVEITSTMYHPSHESIIKQPFKLHHYGLQGIFRRDYLRTRQGFCPRVFKFRKRTDVFCRPDRQRTDQSAPLSTAADVQGLYRFHAPVGTQLSKECYDERNKWASQLAAETESIDSEKWLFDYKLQEYKDCIPNLISRRQFNDRRKKTAGLCEELRKRVAMEMDGGEEQFFVDSKPIEVCRVARGKRCKMGRTGDFSQAPDFGFCASQNTYYLVISYTLSVGYVELSIPMISQRQVRLISIIWRMWNMLITTVASMATRVYWSWCTAWLVRNRTHKTGVSVSAQPEGLEADIHFVCKGKKEDWDNILTTYRPVLGHQKLCENNEWFVCQNHRQN